MKRTALLSLCGLALVLAAVTSAAKPPPPTGGRPRPRPKTEDAGSDAGEVLTIPTASAATTAVAPASSTPADTTKADIGDGGVRPSPLNPAANEFPQGSSEGGAPLDYDRLLADIAALRARVASAGDALFKSKLGITVKLEGKHARVGRLTVSLDDGAVYNSPNGFRADDWTPVFDHAVAPGRHAVTLDIERKDDRDEGFRSNQRSRFTVEVPKEQRLELQVLLIDESDMGGDFPADRSGKYDLRVKFKATAKAAK